MAKNKRVFMNEGINDIDMNDLSAMTDQERARLRGDATQKPKRAM